MGPEHDDYAEDGPPPTTLGSLAVDFDLAFAAVLGPLFALMAFGLLIGLW
jgi:hypothetical protein